MLRNLEAILAGDARISPRRGGASFPREGMFAPFVIGLAQVVFHPTPADMVKVDGLKASKGAWGHISLAPCAWNLTCSLG